MNRIFAITFIVLLAAILTYARREWEHRADPVPATQVKLLMEAHAKREVPWTEAELLKLK